MTSDFGGGVIDPQLLASLAPMLQTLHGMVGNSSTDAIAQQQAQALAARTKAAGEAAQQAGGAYQQAAQAPMPQTNPALDAVGQGLGNAASILSRNPDYAHHAAQRQLEEHAQLMQARMENLKALGSIYAQKADMFQQAGQQEQAEKQRMLEKKMLEEYHNQQFILDDLKNQRDVLARIQAANIAGSSRENVAQTNAQARLGAASISSTGGGGSPDWLDKYIKSTTTGKSYLDASNLTGKDAQMAAQYAASKGVPLFKGDEVAQIRDIATARKNNNSIMGQLDSLLPKGAADRVARLPGIKFSQLFQTSDQRAAFNSWRAAAIRNLRAMAGSKSFRMTEAEIKLAVQNDIPNITDTYGAAKQKLANVNAMLENAESPLFGSGTQPQADPLGIR